MRICLVPLGVVNAGRLGRRVFKGGLQCIGSFMKNSYAYSFVIVKLDIFFESVYEYDLL